MHDQHRDSADRMRSQIERGVRDPDGFRAALGSVPPVDRDGWVDRVLGLGDLPEDGPELPRDCVPYLPCSVDTLLRVVDHAPVRSGDVFVDIGAGLGRAAAVVHLLTKASTIAIEIQPRLAGAARDLAGRLLASNMTCIEGDAAELGGCIATGSVFFLYCPFSGQRLAKLIGELEAIARTRAISVCCVDLPLPDAPWLAHVGTYGVDLAIYRSH